MRMKKDEDEKSKEKEWKWKLGESYGVKRRMKKEEIYPEEGEIIYEEGKKRWDICEDEGETILKKIR